MTTKKRHLGELLYKAGLVKKEVLIEAIKSSKNSNKRLGEVLVEKGIITEDILTKVLAKQFGIEYINVDKASIPTDATKLIPEDLTFPLGIR